MIRAALIDMDGFLINSEHLFPEANKIYFKQFNFEFTEEHNRQITGKKFEEWIKIVVPNLDKSGEELLKERNVIFFDIVRQKLELLPGAEELLKLLHKNFKTALVTSSKRDYIELVFSKTNISQYFDVQITGEIVIHGKPNPECYLMAAEKLGVKTYECAVFEDAPNGILAGKNAGMKVIAVPSPFVIGDEAFKKADIVVNSLPEITLNIING